MICKFDNDECFLTEAKEPTELECIACGLRAIAKEIHPEDGRYEHVVFMGNTISCKMEDN